MSPITSINQFIQQEKEREAKATKGPWTDFAGVITADGKLIGINSRKYFALSADGDLLTTARNNYPVLLEELQRLVGALGQLINEFGPVRKMDDSTGAVADDVCSLAESALQTTATNLSRLV